MSNCNDCGDAFDLARRSGTAMNVVAVIQHTAGEYLGLIEDHLEGRRIRFQYFRPFAGGRKLPDPGLPADALVLLGGGPWGASGVRDLPTLAEEVELTRMRLAEGTPVVGFGLGAQILALAAGGQVEEAPLTFEAMTVTRVVDDALNGFLPETFTQVVYMRDRAVPPPDARLLAVDEQGRPAVWQVGDDAFGFSANPGIKLGMAEDLIMEFEEVPDDTASGLESLRGLQSSIEDDLVPIMTGLVQLTRLMSSPKAAAKGTELDESLV